MYKYKYLLTMLAMLSINLFLYYYYADAVLATYYLILGGALLLFKAIIIRQNGDSMLEQYKQWLAELSILTGLGGWGFLDQHLFLGVVFLVGAAIGLIAFAIIALCSEMSTMDEK